MAYVLNEEQKQELGLMIQKYRHRMVQMNNGKSWTQEDLAVAINSDKAHINRIEKGKQVPMEQTLERICKALNLSWEEERWVISKAGYYSLPPAPEEDDVNSVVEFLNPHIMKLPTPAILIDKEAMIWDVNALEAYLFFGYKNREDFLDECLGMRIIELLMTPRFSDWFSKIIDNYDEYLKRQIKRFMMLYMHYQYSEEYQNIRDRILEIEHMKRIWDASFNGSDNTRDILFLNHQLLQITHPDEGPYEVQIWHSEVAFDERFSVTQHMPNDIHTMQLFAKLNGKI